jgi:hypothetical protein
MKLNTPHVPRAREASVREKVKTAAILGVAFLGNTYL